MCTEYFRRLKHRVAHYYVCDIRTIMHNFRKAAFKFTAGLNVRKNLMLGEGKTYSRKKNTN
jgi:hypothetical protein